jgi:hypothetical protein
MQLMPGQVLEEETVIWLKRLCVALLLCATIFFVMALIENVADGGPRRTTINSLMGLVSVLVTGGALLFVTRNRRP